MFEILYATWYIQLSVLIFLLARNGAKKTERIKELEDRVKRLEGQY